MICRNGGSHGNRWEVYRVLEDIEQKADVATTCCQPRTGELNAEGKLTSAAAAARC